MKVSIEALMSPEHLVADIPAKAIIRKGGEICLVQEPDGRWELPGGRMHVGETPPEAVKREVKEETGLDIEVEELFDCYLFSGKTGLPHFAVVFKARLLDENQEAKLDEREAVAVRWLAPAEALSLPGTRPEYLPVLKKLI